MTRDALAMAAMQGLLAAGELNHARAESADAPELALAALAYDLADAMLIEREIRTDESRLASARRKLRSVK